MEVQGHRGACGLMAENTLPSFEVALDFGVDSIETDVHLSKDGVPVLFHDAQITENLCPGQSAGNPRVRSLTLTELRAFRILNSPMERATKAAAQFAVERGVHPFGIPTLAELFEFVKAYAESPAKTSRQREAARRLWFDVELKRVPFRPEVIGDGFDGTGPALLETSVLDAIHEAGVLERTRVRGFDHRSIMAIRRMEPRLTTGLLVYHTAIAHPELLLNAAGAELYCPDYLFVDADIVRRVHGAGKRIIPYSVNDPEDWRRLCEMGVDGITTDYPDRLIAWLACRSEGETS